MKKIIAIILCAVVALGVVAACNGTPEPTANEKAYSYNLERAKQLTETVNTKFLTFDEFDRECYKEYYNDSQRAYLWSHFSITGKQYAYVKANPSDEAAKELFRKQTDMFELYLHKGNEVPAGARKYHSAFGALGGTGAVYFDDNIWTARNYLFAYEIFGDSKYLERAKETTAFVYSGWDNQLGGLVWNEAGLTDTGTADELERGLSANACSIIVSAELFGLTGQQSYMDWADKFYDFCKTLQDPVTKNYYNGWHTVLTASGRISGSINKVYYSYNPGSMIIADVKLYELTGKDEYLEDAILAAEAAFKASTIYDPVSKTTVYGGFLWFNTVLLDSYIKLYPYNKEKITEYITAYEESLNYAYDKKRNDDGLIPDTHMGLGWGRENGNKENYRLLNQAANAELFSWVSLYYKILADEEAA